MQKLLYHTFFVESTVPLRREADAVSEGTHADDPDDLNVRYLTSAHLD